MRYKAQSMDEAADRIGGLQKIVSDISADLRATPAAALWLDKASERHGVETHVMRDIVARTSHLMLLPDRDDPCAEIITWASAAGRAA